MRRIECDICGTISENQSGGLPICWGYVTWSMEIEKADGRVPAQQSGALEICATCVERFRGYLKRIPDLLLPKASEAQKDA